MPKRKKEEQIDVLSDWHWPFLRINFNDAFELECPHGVGHGGIHGCDGCCLHSSFDSAMKRLTGELNA